MRFIEHNHEERFLEIRRHLIEQLAGIADPKDLKGLELVSLIKVISSYYNKAVFHDARTGELSGPRMGILLRLFAAEKNGNQGVNPTELSRFHNVKKIRSALCCAALKMTGTSNAPWIPVTNAPSSSELQPKGESRSKKLGHNGYEK